MEVFVARQPIFDRQRQLYGYELLFRSGATKNAFDGPDGATATRRLISNTLLAIGLDKLLGGKKAFINFDRALLMGDLHAVLPPETLVIEVLETVEPDEEAVAACQRLSKEGYTLAMDDFVPDPRFEPLARLAKLIKVDLLATPRADQQRLIGKYRPMGIAMLAEKVETQEEFEWALSAGYDYYQGYFFARPETVRGQRIPAAKLNCLRLLAEVQQVEPDFERLESLISSDVSLSYSLMLYVNSALFSRTTAVRSIQRAITLLGQEGMRNWAVLAAAPAMAKNKPGELVTLSLVRARFCERIASFSRIAQPSLALLMGLFSLIDGLTDLPLREALSKVRADPAITGALTETAPQGDGYRVVYQLARSYEAADWDAVTDLASRSGVRASELAEAYAESLSWAQEALHATRGKGHKRRNVRHAITGELSLVCEDRFGRPSAVPATLQNISARGMQVQTSEPIRIDSLVQCSDAKLHLSGTATVRYCKPAKGKYLVGLEFPEGTGWTCSEAPGD